MAEALGGSLPVSVAVPRPHGAQNQSRDPVCVGLLAGWLSVCLSLGALPVCPLALCQSPRLTVLTSVFFP